MYDTLIRLGSPDVSRPLAALILDAAVKSAALLLLAGALTAAMRRHSAALRHLVWTLAAAGLLLIPALSATVPKWRLAVRPSAPAAVGAPAAAPVVLEPAAAASDAPSYRSHPSDPSALAGAQPAAVARAQKPAGLAAFRAAWRWSAWIVLAWLAGALAMLLPLACGALILAWKRRHAVEIHDNHWTDLAVDLALRLGLLTVPPLLRGAPSTMPMACGLFLPVIFLPADADAWAEEKRRAVLAHELAHVRRRDCLIHALARLALALHWFDPLAGVALRRLRIERERACDDLVLAAGTRPSAYADQLLEIARTARAGLLARTAAITMARRSQLEGRLLSILDANRNRRAASRPLIAKALALAALVIVALASLQLARRPAVAQPAPSTTASAAVAAPGAPAPSVPAPGTPVPSAPAAPSASPAAVLTVSKDGQAQFASIRAAVEAAPAGATVRIAPGAYEERLDITKPITLEGAGWEQTSLVNSYRFEDIEAEFKRMEKELQAKFANPADRARMQAEFRKLAEAQMSRMIAVRIQDAAGVVIRNLKITSPGKGTPGSTSNLPLVECRRSRLLLDGCALLGAPHDGLYILDGSNAEVRNSLIAAFWGTGIVIGDPGNPSRAHIHDCDIRNCYYAGMRAGSNDTLVERCRISGTAWHGIRYDNASPTITGNVFSRIARCGIYASGRTAATVRNNIFHGMEMGGISCWFENTDTIEQNSFVGNLREGIAVLGASTPVVRKNIFADNPTAVMCGKINDARATAQAVGSPVLQDNVFWQNKVSVSVPNPDWKEGDPPEQATVSKPLAPETRSLEIDPRLRAPSAKDFALAADSPARAQGIGAADPLPFASPWPLQPEEKAIIPEGDSYDSRQWKPERERNN